MVRPAKKRALPGILTRDSYGQLGLALPEEGVIAAHYPDLCVLWIVTWRS